MDKLQTKTIRIKAGKSNQKEDKTRSKEQDTTEEESPLIQALCLRSTELVGQVKRTRRLSLLLDALDLAMSRVGRQEKRSKADGSRAEVKENEVTRSHAVSRAGWTQLEHQAGYPLPQNEGGSMPTTEEQKKTEAQKRNERRTEDKVRHDTVGTSQQCAAGADGAVAAEGETSDARSRLVSAIQRLMAVLRRRRKRKENTAAKRLQSVYRRIMARGEEGKRKQVRVWRSVTIPRCLWGRRLAKQADFDRQKEESDAIQKHWEQYMYVFYRLEKTNVIVGDLCSSEGGQVDGIEDLPHCEHRACDIVESAKYVEAYGRDRLTVGDATLEETLRRMGPVHLYTASPPCQGTSRMPKAGGGTTESKEPKLIQQMRQTLQNTGKPFCMENPLGAYQEGQMRNDLQLTNHDFGLRAYRPRCFECTEKLQKDTDSKWLTKQCCLGPRNRVPRLDKLDRRMPICCQGCHEAVYSAPTKGVTNDDWSDAMGIMRGRMSLRGLALAIPPASTKLIVCQMVASIFNKSKWAVPIISYKEAQENPALAAVLKRFVEGAGPEGVDHLMAEEKVNRKGGGGQKGKEQRGKKAPLHCAAEADGVAAVGSQETSEAQTPPDVSEARAPFSPEQECDSSGEDTNSECDTEDENVQGRRRASRRQRRKRTATRLKTGWYELPPVLSADQQARLYYQSEGWYDVLSTDGNEENLSFLSKRLKAPVEKVSGEGTGWAGRHVLSVVSPSGVRAAVHAFKQARAIRGDGSAVTIACWDLPESHGGRALRREGAKLVTRVCADAGFGESKEVAVWQLGERGLEVPSTVLMTEEQVMEKLTPLDVGERTATDDEKWLLRNGRIPRDSEVWRRKGYSDETCEVMTHGTAPPLVEPGPEKKDFGRYPENVPGDDWAIAMEMRRCMNRGAMRWADQDEAVLIHPHVVVWQKGKPRACMDCSVGLNKHVGKAPFALGNVWQLRKWAKPTSWFARFDIADGFWFVPIQLGSQKYFAVRHPWVRVPPDKDAWRPDSAAHGVPVGEWHPDSGKIAVCTSIPFGYRKSPEVFCGITNEIAEKLRKELGIKVIVFVDDFGVIADSREELEADMKKLEDYMAELKVQLSPWKTYGPSRHMELLGLQLCNIEGNRSISLPHSKVKKVLQLIKEFELLKPGDVAKPLKVAALIGLLNFAAMVVDGCSIFLDRMYNQFRGVLIDWKRGLVKVDHRARYMRLKAEFFEDLRWWKTNVATRSSVPLLARGESESDGVVSGTDASGWGAGQLVWLSGEREENQIEYCPWEKDQPVNWRELMSAVHILHEWGPRLAGRKLTIETDNMASYWCIKRRRARTGLMAELLRRLYTLAARWDVEIAITHTPGVKLIQNDRVSRGKEPAPPRQWLKQEVYAELDRKWGPFDSGMGAETEHALEPNELSPAGREEVLWYHPAHCSVAATLKLAWSRVAASRRTEGGMARRHVRGLVVVPDWEHAAWNGLLGGMRKVWECAQGSHVLEEWRGGSQGWVGVSTLTGVCAYAFPDITDMKLIRCTASQLKPADYVAQFIPLASRDDPSRALAVYQVVLPPNDFVLQENEVPVIELLHQKSRERRSNRAGCRAYAASASARSKVSSYADSEGNPWAVRADTLYFISPWVEQLGEKRVMLEYDRFSGLCELHDSLLASSGSDTDEADSSADPTASDGCSLVVDSESVLVMKQRCMVCNLSMQGAECSKVRRKREALSEAVWVHSSCTEAAADMMCEQEAACTAMSKYERAVHTDPASPEQTGKLVKGMVVDHFSQLFGAQTHCDECKEKLKGRPCTYLTWEGTSHGAWVHDECVVCVERRRPKSPMVDGEGLAGRVPAQARSRSAERVRPAERRPLNRRPDAEANAFICPPCQPVTSGGEYSELRSPARPTRKDGRIRLQRDGGRNVRSALADDKLSEIRLGRCMDCVQGKCEQTTTGLGERDVRCIGTKSRPECDECVHSFCFNLAPGLSEANKYMCPKCRMSELSFVEEPSDEEKELVLEDVLRTCVRTMAGVGFGTGQIIRQIRNKERAVKQESKLKDLFTSVAGLEYFAEWLARYGMAASTIALYVRLAGQLGRDDPNSDGEDTARTHRVKEIIKNLEKEVGTDRDADTPLTLSMFLRSLKKLRVNPKRLLATRDGPALVMGFQGGARCGEEASDEHGWQLMKHTRIFADRVEIRLDDSKMSTSAEFVTMARCTTGRAALDFGEMLYEMAAEWGRTVVQGEKGDSGELYDWIDFSVVRVNLQGLHGDTAALEELKEDLKAAPGLNQRECKHLMDVVIQKSNNKREGSRYINVFGGEEMDCERVLTWWLSRRPHYGAKVVAGPALCSTLPGSVGTRPGFHSFSTGSLSSTYKKTFDEAFDELMSEEDDQVIAELSCLPANINGPKWNSHSCRRGGTKLAREIRDAETDEMQRASEADIDRHFRWISEHLTREQQLAYAGMLSSKQRCRVTKKF